MVHHEPVPEWKDRDGNVIGMEEMVMSFPPAEGLDLGDIQKGDIVELSAVMRYQPTMEFFTDGVTKLPADTVLNLTPPSTQPATQPE